MKEIVVGLFVQVAFVFCTTCPKNPTEQVKECTNRVLPELSINSGVDAQQRQVDRARDFCKDSRLRDVADCIQDILDRCRGTTDEEQVLHRLIDKDKTMKTVDYFCKHFRVYERHAGCISAHHEQTSLCSQDARDSFTTKLQAGANIDVLIVGSCRFFHAARSCLTNTTAGFCGQEAANFVYTLLSGYMPPYCETNHPDSTDTPIFRDTYDHHHDNGNSGSIITTSYIALLWMILYVLL
ncbi:uncharacterized protein LOC127869109 [Dreissena polymorpha]|uniref:uncharacterized protein LOC127869109 n=1 Tax=Dreissena polymorpha TaxID=45954 RepID=UPI0022653EE1|nr:uncharacterized protein LOC127869109 [Dreissena polymorpha]